MSKNMVMIQVKESEKEQVVKLIMDFARSGADGNSGDGKIFVLPVIESYTISSLTQDDEE